LTEQQSGPTIVDVSMSRGDAVSRLVASCVDGVPTAYSRTGSAEGAGDGRESGD
jgi:hypothetical protein